MANTIEADLASSLSKLAPTFQTAIKATIEAESDPLKRVQAQKDSIDVRKGLFTDIKSNLDALQNAVQSLISTQTSYAGFSLNSKTSVSPTTAGSSVLTASSSSTAVVSDYEIAVTKLAKGESRTALAAADPDLALGKSGTLWLGGNGTADVIPVPDTLNPTNTSATTGTVASGQRELGSGDYSVQVRDSAGVRQFRLVNADGSAMSILGVDGKSFTTGWQTQTDGSRDTGRGMILSLSTAGAVGSTALRYTAKGTALTVSATDTQRTLTAAINSAVQPEGRDFKASVIGGKMVFSATQTGVSHSMVYNFSPTVPGPDAGLGDANLQDAQNAEFKINGMSITRASNTNLSDVIDGVTLNLASDGEGKTARLSITNSADGATNAMNAFVSKFNATYSYLTSKMATTSKTDPATGKTTYTRGSLTSETVFRSLRSDLPSQITRSISNSGALKSLADIGLSFDKDMNLTLDAAKFSTALKANASDVTALLDGAMGQFNTTLSHHTGSTGSVQSTLTSMETQRKSYDARIGKYNDNLNQRKQALINQYLSIQTQMADWGYQGQMLGISLTGTSFSTNG